MIKETKIDVHQAFDPWHNKHFKVNLFKDGKLLEGKSEDKVINSKYEFQTILEEVKQFNHEKGNMKLGLTKRIITY